MNRVLVVDDEAGYRKFFCKFLGLHGFNPVEAADGEEGLALARSEKPDLIFMDWCLPGRSGLEVVRSLRREPGTAPIPVVMMSSLKESAEEEFRALGAGADFFLDKRELNPGDEHGVKTFLRHMRALMLRGASNSSVPKPLARVYETADLRFDAANAILVVAGRVVRLPPKELALLEFFLRFPDALHSAEKLWRVIWGSPHGNWEHTLASTVSALRKSLGFEWSARIINVKAQGYRLALSEPF